MNNLERAMSLRSRVKLLHQQVHGMRERGYKYRVTNGSSYPEATPYFNPHLGDLYMRLSIQIEESERSQYQANRTRTINDRALADALAKIIEKELPKLMEQAADLLDCEAADAARLAEKEYETMKSRIEILRNAYPEKP